MAKCRAIGPDMLVLPKRWVTTMKEPAVTSGSAATCYKVRLSPNASFSSAATDTSPLARRFSATKFEKYRHQFVLWRCMFLYMVNREFVREYS